MKSRLFLKVGCALFFDDFSAGGQFLTYLGHFKAIFRMAIFDFGSEFGFENFGPSQKAEI